MKNNVILTLTTGRSGTSWIHSVLKTYYSNEICAIQTEGPCTGFHPRVFFRSYKDNEIMKLMEESIEISRHLTFVREQIRTKSYIDTGWVLYAAIPLFIKHFPDRVKIVYLTRHPLNVAASWTNKGMYSKERINDYIHQEAFLTPFDKGIFHSEYSKRWKTMSSFEKNLFNWAEIQLYVQEIKKKYNHAPFFEVKFEDLISNIKIRKAFLAFLNLPYKSEIEEKIGKKVGRNSEAMKLKWPVGNQWKSFEDILHIIAVAKELGYDLDK